MDEDRTADAYTNTDPQNKINIINTDQIKKSRITSQSRIITLMSLKYTQI